MPKLKNEQEVLSRNQPLTFKGYYDASNNLIYGCWSFPGLTTAQAGWMIGKYTWDASNNCTDIQWADGGAFTQIPDNRVGLTYS
jgi:hypothetical protein